jgi:hypothetical protein
MSLAKVDSRIVDILEPLRKVGITKLNLAKGPGLTGEVLKPTFARDKKTNVFIPCEG